MKEKYFLVLNFGGFKLMDTFDQEFSRTPVNINVNLIGLYRVFHPKTRKQLGKRHS